MKTTKVAVLGKGNVGSALARGLSRSYSQVQAVGNDKAAQRQAASQAEIVFLAVPFPAIDDVVKNVGEALNGKVVADVTNALDANMNWAVGYSRAVPKNFRKSSRGRGSSKRSTRCSRSTWTPVRSAPSD